MEETSLAMKQEDRKRKLCKLEHDEHPYSKDQDGDQRPVGISFLPPNESNLTDSDTSQAATIRSDSPRSQLQKAASELAEILKRAGIQLLTSTGSAGESTSQYRSSEIAVQKSANDEPLSNHDSIDLKPPLTPENNTTDGVQYPGLTLPEMRQRAMLGSNLRSTYCRNFLKDRIRDGNVTCNICGLTLHIARSKGIRGTRIWDHVGKHVGKLLVECRLCDHKAYGIASINYHLRRKHGTGMGGNVIDMTKSDDHREEFILMFERCFGDHQDNSNDDMLLSLMEYCRRAAKDAVLDGYVRCSICDVSLRISVTRHQACESYRTALDHATKHVRPMLYSCRLCEHAFASKSAALEHLERRHGESKNMDLVDDQTESRETEIKGVIDYCYGGLPISQNSKYDISKETLNHLLRARYNTLHVRCTELVDKFERKKRLECQICSKTVLVRAMDNKRMTRFAIDHISEHLGKQLYQCKHCVKWTCGHQPMLMHINQRHRISASGAYVDHSYKHVDELLRMMAQCYDKGYTNDIMPAITVKYEDDDEPSTSTGKVSKKRSNVRHKYNTRNRAPIKEEVDAAFEPVGN